jgi:hypothetical protein
MTALMPAEVQVTVGVDAHADVHVAAALDQMGRLLATQSVPSRRTLTIRVSGYARAEG